MAGTKPVGPAVTVVEATLDRCEGGIFVPEDTVLARPDRALVADLFGRLDGRRHTELGLRRSDGYGLIVGGGDDGRYIVTRFAPDDRSSTLVRPDEWTGAKVVLFIGGQDGDYDQAIVCPEPLARLALEGFCSGADEPSVVWVDD